MGLLARRRVLAIVSIFERGIGCFVDRISEPWDEKEWRERSAGRSYAFQRFQLGRERSSGEKDRGSEAGATRYPR
jgi:hypothetical protein